MADRQRVRWDTCCHRPYPSQRDVQRSSPSRSRDVAESWPYQGSSYKSQELRQLTCSRYRRGPVQAPELPQNAALQWNDKSKIMFQPSLWAVIHVFFVHVLFFSYVLLLVAMGKSSHPHHVKRRNDAVPNTPVPSQPTLSAESLQRLIATHRQECPELWWRSCARSMCTASRPCPSKSSRRGAFTMIAHDNK